MESNKAMPVQLMNNMDNMEDNAQVEKEMIADKLVTGLNRALHLINKYQKDFLWLGGFYYLVEWRPFMLALKDFIFGFRTKLRQKTDDNELTYEELHYMASLVYEILASIHEKNYNVDKYMDIQYAHQNMLFEPVISEFYRKIADIVLVTKTCNSLEPHKSKYRLNFPGDREIQNTAMAVGRLFCLRSMTLNDIIDILPEVTTAQLEAIARYRKIKEMLIKERAAIIEEDPPVRFQLPEDEWTKRMEEMITMSAFMVLRGGYSSNWRSSLIRKLDKIRPTVQRGKPDADFASAQEYLVNNYYRLRKAYDMHRRQLERDESFLRKELEICG